MAVKVSKGGEVMVQMVNGGCFDWTVSHMNSGWAKSSNINSTQESLPGCTLLVLVWTLAHFENRDLAVKSEVPTHGLSF